MRSFSLILIAFLLTGYGFAQQATQKNDFNISFTQLGPDSAVFYYEPGWHLVKPECASTYRYTKLTPDGHFTGQVKDFNRDSTLTFSGFYQNKQKQGLFEGFHHRSGLPKFSGWYENNRRVGNWQYWYENGKPQITLKFANDSVYILEAWNRDGKQTVVNGNGTVKIENLDIIEGKVKNGLMAGIWLYHRSNGYIYFQEKFEDGRFVKGFSARENYTEKTRFGFLQEPDAVVKGENLVFSPTCVIIPKREKRNIVAPVYNRGNDHLNSDFGSKIRGRAATQGDEKFTGSININFTVNKNGEVVDIEHSGFKMSAPAPLVDELKKIVAHSGKWQPALLDQKPVDFSMQLHVEFKQNTFFVQTRFFAPLEEERK